MSTFRKDGTVTLEGVTIGTIEKTVRFLTGQAVYKHGRHVGWGGTRAIKGWKLTTVDGTEYDGRTRNEAVGAYIRQTKV